MKAVTSKMQTELEVLDYVFSEVRYYFLLLTFFKKPLKNTLN